MTRSLPTRSELNPERTWDAWSVFGSFDAWQSEMDVLEHDIAGLHAFQGRLTDATTVLKALALRELLNGRMERAYVFASLFASVDTADQDARARFGRATSLWAQLRAAEAFIEPELLALGRDQLEQWMGTEAKLGVYRQYFDSILGQAAHTRSAEVEALLGALDDAFRTAAATHSTLTNTDLRFEAAVNAVGESFEVAQGSLGKLLTDPDRVLRRSAWASYADGHLAFKNTMANALAAGIKQDVFRARTRGYGSSLEAALGPMFVPAEVFHTLVSTFKRFIPVWHRYWAFRKRALRLEVFEECDVRAPLTGSMPRMTFEQAVDCICQGMAPLGKEYVSIMRRGVLEERWVDVYPNRGKRMGAFSTGAQGTHPFIMMSYQDSLLSLSTLAHELGHSMHSYLTWRAQPHVYAGYSMFVAEVASNFNQALVRAHLLKTNPDRNFQISLLEEAMANFHRYFFVMPTLARFELEIHERTERGEALTADGLIQRCADLFTEAYGPSVSLDRDRVGIIWAQFSSHLYSNFYVFQYATGISGAHALAQGVLEGRANAADNYLSFLSSGSSLYPLDALKLAGVDLSSPAPIEATFRVLEGYVDRLEALLG